MTAALRRLVRRGKSGGAADARRRSKSFTASGVIRQLGLRACWRRATFTATKSPYRIQLSTACDAVPYRSATWETVKAWTPAEETLVATLRPSAAPAVDRPQLVLDAIDFRVAVDEAVTRPPARPDMARADHVRSEEH